MMSVAHTVWFVDGILVRDNTPHVMRLEGYPPEAVDDALDSRGAMLSDMTLPDFLAEMRASLDRMAAAR